MDISYVPLRLRSNYSLLAGTMSLEEIVERACRMGLKAVALTDINNLYGAVAFQRLAAERGLKAIVGAELHTNSERATLLARNREGYTNLCRAITRLHLDEGAGGGTSAGEGAGSAGGIAEEDGPPGAGLPGAGLPGAGLAGAGLPGAGLPLAQLLDEGVEGLHCIVEEPTLAERLAELFPRERLWLELATPGRLSSQWERNVAKGRALGIGVVATGEAWFGAAEDWALHRALRAVAGKTLIQRAGAEEGVAHPNSYMASPEQMARRLGRCAWGLGESVALAEDCDVAVETGGHIFPCCDLEPGETPRSRLTDMCRGGLKARFGSSPPARALKRLRRELDVIDELGFWTYFLAVGEIVAWARGRGIPVVGRGSGASSFVAYLLGITGVDPLKYSLCFERFLSSSRPDYPDLDVDLCWRRRDEVIEHVYERYGHDRVAMISTHVTFQRRSAIREMSKVWGLAPDEVLKTLKEWGRAREREDGRGSGVVVSGRGERANGAVMSEEPLRTVLAMSRRIEGFPRHMGIHCGGLVIAPGPLRDIVPLERAPKGVVVTQYEMNAVEGVGLVKMDLLGNRGLTIAQDCMAMSAARAGSADAGAAPGDGRAWQHRGRRHVPAAIEDIPDGDRHAAALLAAGDTLGCFQIESPAMRQLLSMIEPRDSGEVIAAVALVRPGPSGSGMKEAFIRRKRGLERTRYTHPCLAPILKDTYGVMLYEEDVLKVAAVVAGLSLEDGDNLRRAIADAAPGEELARVRRGFLEMVRRRGMAAKTAKALWDDLARFSSYAFCKAHAAGYGLLAYRTAYLKAYCPIEFAVAVLNNHGGMYPTAVHLEDARRRGVEILGPCVNQSAKGFTVEGEAVRVGLGRVKGLRDSAIEQILSVRRGAPFKSLGDLLGRVDLAAPEAEALTLAGALDFTGVPRPALLLEALVWGRAGRGGCGRGIGGVRGGGLGRQLLAPVEVSSHIRGLREFSGELRLEMEGRHLGLTPSRHPVERVGPRHPGAPANGKNLVTCSALRGQLGRGVGIVGTVSARRRIRTESGEPMLFLTLEDATGIVEVVVFPNVYRRMTVDLDRRGPLLVRGVVEDHYGALTLVADDVLPARLESAHVTSSSDARGHTGEVEAVDCACRTDVVHANARGHTGEDVEAEDVDAGAHRYTEDGGKAKDEHVGVGFAEGGPCAPWGGG